MFLYFEFEGNVILRKIQNRSNSWILYLLRLKLDGKVRQMSALKPRWQVNFWLFLVKFQSRQNLKNNFREISTTLIIFLLYLVMKNGLKHVLSSSMTYMVCECFYNDNNLDMYFVFYVNFHNILHFIKVGMQKPIYDVLYFH